MNNQKLRNISYSVVLVTVWLCIICILSARSSSGDISVLYFWTKLTSVFAIGAGVLMICFRAFKVIDKNTNLLYCFLGTINVTLGLGGLLFHWLHKINAVGMQDLLLNLLTGAIVLGDVFLFDTIFLKNG